MLARVRVCGASARACVCFTYVASVSGNRQQCSGDRECRLLTVKFHVHGGYPVGNIDIEGPTTAMMAMEEGRERGRRKTLVAVTGPRVMKMRLTTRENSSFRVKLVTS